MIAQSENYPQERTMAKLRKLLVCSLENNVIGNALFP